ncbi:engulfment and cell motility protein 1-like [Macrosteles quadrilineatus]|uniref:engulfment and cell motility protein 1-like n=1 Tax=Macrosteles quadrilineatus TaxID=74068 RepID=UPI0023E0A0EA|nr:engulfment and cell motility protein 1-like [Macrosteles quadrilineatus]
MLTMQSPSSDVVKVAIQSNNNAILFKLAQDQPLEIVIQEVCEQSQVTFEKNKFALQLLSQVSDNDSFTYITEFNRYMIKNGHELKLVYSAPLLAKMIREKLDSNSSIENLHWALKKAAICSADPTFCKEFFPLGYSALRKLLNESVLTKDLFSKALQVILNLIKNNFLKALDKEFLLQLKDIVTSDHHIQESIIETALEVLEAIVLAKNDSEFLTSLVSVDDIVHHLWSRDSPQTQSNVLALLNAMTLKSTRLKNQRMLLQKMNSKPLKDTIYTNIISTNSQVPAYLSHELYVYQSLILTLDKQRYRRVVKSDSFLPDVVPYLKSNTFEKTVKKELDANFFPLKTANSNVSLTKADYQDEDNYSLTPSMSSSVLYASDDDEEVDDTVFVPEVKRNGSKNDKLISQLTFDCVFYFHTNHHDDYKIALSDDGNSYTRYLQTCEQIVQLLCTKVLRIGYIPERDETAYCPLVFLTASPFLEELFSKTVNLMHKTKREMKAKNASDLEKVFQVLQRQLLKALETQPVTFDQLDSVLSTLSYWAVRNQWQEEQVEKERNTLANSPAVRQLKASLVGETKEIIKKQRLQFVKTGSEFPVWNAQRNQRVRNKTWFASLTTNEKAIQYYEVEGEVNQLMMEDVKSIVTGRRCPHIKLSKSRVTSGELAFSLITEESSLDFIAPTQEVYDHWTDAINSLLGNEMKSIGMKRDLNCLIDMELRLRLLNLDGIDIPDEAPPIPLDPPSYDFCNP